MLICNIEIGCKEFATQRVINKKILTRMKKSENILKIVENQRKSLKAVLNINLVLKSKTDSEYTVIGTIGVERFKFISRPRIIRTIQNPKYKTKCAVDCTT